MYSYNMRVLENIFIFIILNHSSIFQGSSLLTVRKQQIDLVFSFWETGLSLEQQCAHICVCLHLCCNDALSLNRSSKLSTGLYEALVLLYCCAVHILACICTFCCYAYISLVCLNFSCMLFCKTGD